MRLNIVRSLEQKAELLLTTGTFNLLSKIEPHSRLSGAFSTEWKPATCAVSVLELCFQPLPSAGSGQSQTFQTYREFPQPVNPFGRQLDELAVENWVPVTDARCNPATRESASGMKSPAAR